VAVREHLHWRLFSGKECYKAKGKDCRKTEEGDVVVLEAVIEQRQIGDIINHKNNL